MSDIQEEQKRLYKRAEKNDKRIEKLKCKSWGDKDKYGNFVSSPFPTEIEFMDKINEIIDKVNILQDKE